MNILLHVCCGPCTLFPLRVLREQGHQVKGFFYNPNIHPYREFKRRINTLAELAEREKFTVEIDDNYGLRDYLRKIVFHEQQRCSICYDMRFEQVARVAGEMGVDAFSSTLLYSKFQNHGQIREKGEQMAEKFGVAFHYQDFRTGWQEGIDRSKEMELYRQPYCGCIYSEQERYDKSINTINHKNSSVPHLHTLRTFGIVGL